MERWAIPLAWLVFLAIWFAMARDVKAIATRLDRGLQRRHYLPLAVAIVLLSVPIPLFPFDARFVPAASWPPHLGLAFVIAGIAFSVWARVRIAGNWSSDVTLKHDHELIVDGPYRFARHPIYTGVLLGLAGTALAIGEGRAVIAVAIAAWAFWRKLGLEEGLLRGEFGATYDRYAEKTAALIPFLL